MITIKNAKVLCREAMEIQRLNIIIQDNEIVELTPRGSKGRVVDGQNCVAAPALINSHVHIGDSVAKDVGDGEPIEKIVKPPDGIKHRILNETSSKEMVSSMRNSMKEMLQTGTTTFVDFREGGVEGIEILESASQAIPIRKIVLGRHSAFQESDDLSEIKMAAMEILNHSDGIGLSGFGEIKDDVARLIVETCDENGKIAAIHVAEYLKVQNESLNIHGKTEIQRAVDAGFKLLIHMTEPMDHDLETVGRSNATVVSCPRSNGALSVGIPPLKAMLDNGVNVALGTDNLMFNSPNMFSEMEYALKVTRGFYKTHIDPLEIFKMATVNPAKALGLETGVIEEGKIADIMLIKGVSGDPILSIINRTGSKGINTLIKDGSIVFGA
jgi:cytosine/adenosine deaminase-related metal-dependent hydrolase